MLLLLYIYVHMYRDSVDSKDINCVVVVVFVVSLYA